MSRNSLVYDPYLRRMVPAEQYTPRGTPVDLDGVYSALTAPPKAEPSAVVTCAPHGAHREITDGTAALLKAEAARSRWQALSELRDELAALVSAPELEPYTVRRVTDLITSKLEATNE